MPLHDQIATTRHHMVEGNGSSGRNGKATVTAVGVCIHASTCRAKMHILDCGFASRSDRFPWLLQQTPHSHPQIPLESKSPAFWPEVIPKVHLLPTHSVFVCRRHRGEVERLGLGVRGLQRACVRQGLHKLLPHLLFKP